MNVILWILIISILTAAACSLCGVFLVVKRESFISEGLSHAVLPGIVIAFILFSDRSSPWLIIAAGLSGLIMVWLVQWIVSVCRVDVDAALGIVFCGMFSVGVLASRMNLKNVHFHADCVIDGNLTFAVLNPFKLGELYLGPKSFVVMLVVLLMVVGFIALFYKELKLLCFDQTSSKIQGFRPKILHMAWLGLVSITAVAAFETAGTVLVVALMIAPAATANLLTHRLAHLLWVSVLMSVIASCCGVWLAVQFDVSPAGPIATVCGLLFLLTVVFAPGQGLIYKIGNAGNRKREIIQKLVLETCQRSPLTLDSISSRLTFSVSTLSRALSDGIREGDLELADGKYQTTSQGKEKLQLFTQAI